MNRPHKNGQARLLGDTVEEVLRNNGIFLKRSCFTCGDSPIRRMNAGSLRDVDMIVWEMEKEISFFLPGKKNRSVIGQPACPAGREELLRTLVLRAMEIVLPAAGGKE